MKKISLILLTLFLMANISFAQNLADKSVKSDKQLEANQTLLVSNNVKEIDNKIFLSKEIKLEKRGCCSWHGGVAGCDESTGRIKCRDGSLSPS